MERAKKTPATPARHARPPKPSDEHKFRELMLYIAERSQSDPKFGAIKLNKILFYSDMLAYGKLGQSITDQPYQKLERGPAPRRLVPVRNKMVGSGDCAMQKREYGGFLQERLVALRPPDLRSFSGEEIAIVDTVIQVLWPLTATETSEYSHLEIGWQAAEMNEDIPYEAVLVHPGRALTERELAHARTLKASCGAPTA